MNKVFLLIAITMLTFVNVNGQEVLNKGDKMMNLGLGLASKYGMVPSINFSGEVGVIPTGDIGIVAFGGEAEYKLSTWDSYNYLYTDNGISHSIAIGGRGVWHLHVFNNPKYDLYAGTSVGFKMITNYNNSVEWNPNDGFYTKRNNYSGFYQTIFVGGRIMTSDTFGFFGEIADGYHSISYLKIGMTFKM